MKRRLNQNVRLFVMLGIATTFLVLTSTVQLGQAVTYYEVKVKFERLGLFDDCDSGPGEIYIDPPYGSNQDLGSFSDGFPVPEYSISYTYIQNIQLGAKLYFYIMEDDSTSGDDVIWYGYIQILQNLNTYDVYSDIDEGEGKTQGGVYVYTIESCEDQVFIDNPPPGHWQDFGNYIRFDTYVKLIEGPSFI